MVGDVNLFISAGRDSGELEVMIAEPDARCKGAGTEAVSLLIYYALEVLQLKHFFVKITEDNATSLHLFEDKLNFKRVSYSEVFKEFTLELSSLQALRLKQFCKATIVHYRI
ncbi:acetyltransferase, GNAT family [Dictyocaulus viviparus]|uniref:Acetyltransferase, GNAT family n=1 Tax=Dictyocaulus viviparus TaxID=29172 RepID=A0A0D8Y685_DICVI|nr:acetyltransferase, GNAT family [Dictyocaulus viviparus]